MSAFRRVALVTTGLGFYVAASYSAYQIQRIRNKPSPPEGISEPAVQRGLLDELNSVYSGIASGYDSAIDYDEFWMGLGSKRRSLLSNAKGDVLEIASGTGRNLDKYPKPPQLTSLTVIDRNPEMIKLAWTKYLRLSRNGKDVTTYLPKTTFHVMDAEAAASIPSGQFDTVVDTFGLCSCDDPARIVLEMKRVCKKEGTLLFLEHGRSSWTVAETVSKLINEILDKGSIDHARSWGCWWNRDIEKIIRDAGLIVEQDKRYHFGTTYYIVARNASLS